MWKKQDISIFLENFPGDEAKCNIEFEKAFRSFLNKQVRSEMAVIRFGNGFDSLGVVIKRASGHFVQHGEFRLSV